MYNYILCILTYRENFIIQDVFSNVSLFNFFCKLEKIWKHYWARSIQSGIWFNYPWLVSSSFEYFIIFLLTQSKWKIGRANEAVQNGILDVSIVHRQVSNCVNLKFKIMKKYMEINLWWGTLTNAVSLTSDYCSWCTISFSIELLKTIHRIIYKHSRIKTTLIQKL